MYKVQSIVKQGNRYEFAGIIIGQDGSRKGVLGLTTPDLPYKKAKKEIFKKMKESEKNETGKL